MKGCGNALLELQLDEGVERLTGGLHLPTQAQISPPPDREVTEPA